MSNDENEQEKELTPEDYKEKGNACVKEKNYKEAILHYSNGLRKNPVDFFLYSNRSFAYLKLHQYYYALCDAEKVIEIRPDFVKGYFRKAEVLRETFQYDEALLNYGRALKLEPNNDVIISNLRLTAGMCNRETMLEKNVPWVGAGVGVIVGCAIVISDQFTKTPSVRHPILMVLLVMIAASIGFAIAKSFRFYLKFHRKGMIEAPTELSEDFLIRDSSPDADEDEEQMPKKRNRYSKSQARFRMKKAKT
ncbi:CLUMA_CG020823, isoform A [Clunio marinus]|uniref:CLUMA_CG020823, isoform A n=1 Tax=Clunio marinus TaxID=568069 RepID=A0A1J1J645_9DIPT|nr:CLUMA_CG020823, isoform A [Clunio marinus]